MKITYIYHSSYIIEFEDCYMLFDYFERELPFVDKSKKIYIFSSHSHYDHFNENIFEYFKQYNVEYILSKDIYKKFKIQGDKINYVYANKEYNIDNINIVTLKSTDLGIAFLIKYNGKVIFHSGDLHYWVWQEESKEYNNNMEANYKREIDKLKGITIDIAFIPLDPRQGDWYYKGMEYVISNLDIKNIFPMHCWDRYELIDKFEADGYNINRNKIYKINKPLDTWEV